MAVNDRPSEEEELIASKREMWSGFLRFSTYSIVGIALLLILLAIFLL